ncbi:tRNA (adenosine(37)-N6)-threonylcarbamoyltransferase complex ATPase subunit type 1 TsaE [Candidatus Saccharibacteria bacterium 32-49-10]|nr:MAG: tRNA (adenosine(37)-N6)-threonylcarbamoyltransferase complex ATPase subunit type 1 TsaE [Candidatus Saccharibacteria bacterium 32-49-10]
MIIEISSEKAMRDFGSRIGARLKGGEVLELVGDVGAGKTTFVKGLAAGLGIEGPVQSPSFTISQVYDARDGLRLAHYDFYRLADPGIMADELFEMVGESGTIAAIEWADTVAEVLPDSRYRLKFLATSEDGRRVELPDTLGEKL